MEIKVVKLSRGDEQSAEKGFNHEGEFVRNAYLIYLHQYVKDPLRIEITN